jgi:hypothetical protein
MKRSRMVMLFIEMASFEKNNILQENPMHGTTLTITG